MSYDRIAVYLEIYILYLGLVLDRFCLVEHVLDLVYVDLWLGGGEGGCGQGGGRGRRHRTGRVQS